MYVYFDNNGVVKEIINDKPLRQGDVDVNTIYIYWSGAASASISTIDISYKLEDGTLYSALPVSTTTYEEYVPYDSSRDLKYFNYYDKFTFYKAVVPNGNYTINGESVFVSVLSDAGAVGATIRFNMTGSTTKTMNLFAFMVEESAEGSGVVSSDDYITLGQFRYLLAQVSTPSLNHSLKLTLDDTEVSFNGNTDKEVEFDDEYFGEVSGGDADLTLKVIKADEAAKVANILKVADKSLGHILNFDGSAAKTLLFDDDYLTVVANDNGITVSVTANTITAAKVQNALQIGDNDTYDGSVTKKLAFGSGMTVTVSGNEITIGLSNVFNPSGSYSNMTVGNATEATKVGHNFKVTDGSVNVEFDGSNSRTLTIGDTLKLTQSGNDATLSVDIDDETVTTDSDNKVCVNLSDKTQSGFVKWDADNKEFDTDNNTYQTQLQSGTNIKTINGLSILGAGNIAFKLVDRGEFDISAKTTETITVDAVDSGITISSGKTYALKYYNDDSGDTFTSTPFTLIGNWGTIIFADNVDNTLGATLKYGAVCFQIQRVSDTRFKLLGDDTHIDNFATGEAIELYEITIE